MATRHAVGYSKSTRAKCHAPSTCKGTSMPIGTLRYGQTISSGFGETVEWRHWGCVTPDILGQLSTAPLESVTGFDTLGPADQQKIRMAVALRRVDPGDIPESAKPKGPANLAQPASTATSQIKRSATVAGLDRPSQSSTSQAQPAPSITQRVDDDLETEVIEDEPVDELYCTMSTNVVGIQYYKGMVGSGEEVFLVREPQNPYDRNAIQVKNISRIQVGHLPRNVATKLAPLLDRKAVTVEGVINDGNLSGSRGYTLSITLKIYGASDKRNELETVLVWATPGQRGFGPRNTSSRTVASSSSTNHSASIPRTAAPPSASQRRTNPVQSAIQMEAIRKQQQALQKAAELKQMLNNLEKVDDEGRRTSLLDTLCSNDDVLNLPLYPSPPGIASGELKVDLLKHQLQGLQWCVERENPVLPKQEADKPVQFWQLRKVNNTKTYYYNIATKTPQEAAPILGRGALCADAMGLGKTLTMIALIIATKGDSDVGFSKSTLIVVPVSVLSNWEKQIEDHCTQGALSSCVYYGTKRGLSKAELQKYDVVITTYQTVAGEHDEGSKGTGVPNKKKKTERTLFEVPWKRVILDEGHNIRNPKTKMTKAVCALNASRRWVLTGTPIINSPRDLGSILTFLKICRPLDDEDFYKRLLLRPLKRGDTSGVELLRALMSHICIRRTKEMQDSNGVPIIDLPPVEMIKVPVTLSDEARRLYDEVEHVSKQRLEKFMSGGTTAMVQSNVLSMLTRMRQIALHPGLVPANYLEELSASVASDMEGAAKPIIITSTERLRLQDLLAQAIEDCDECPVCFGVLPNDARITTCAHMFCLACITEILSRDPKCPMDRRPLTAGDLLEPPPPTELTQKRVNTHDEEEPQGIRAGSSAKIDQLVHLLKLTPSTEKSLVFSQFTSFLDKIAEAFEEEGIPFVRFDGQMSAKRRQDAIAQFSVPLEDEVVIPERTARSSRNGSSVILQDGDADEEVDEDFAMDSDEDESDFVDDDDDGPISRKKTMLKGKGKAKPGKLLSSVSAKQNPRVMIISLKAGALGLNLTAANNVYLMDPWWQEGIESQAVDRVNRIGQKKNVHVYQLIAENTVESKVLEIQERKKQLIQQAFSGIKRTETPRQQREARLQDLVELFGIRRQASQAS
ncbi:SNF2 family N-terminal domain-containing protein [Crassisporium funariophilum]|nr:SNF2 family N-terminal domain-containing protein [Crassisporium funariophilum]